MSERGGPPSLDATVRLTRVAAGATAVLTTIAFAIAILTPPRSGPMCAGASCVTYPYTEVEAFFPRDYLWMFPATLLLFAFLVMVVAVHHATPTRRQPHTLVAVTLAAIATALLSLDYFVQFVVVQPSVERGETEGIALLSQYNPHGIFIALESLGYLVMGGALGFMAAAFGGPGRLSRALRWTCGAAPALSVVALAALSVAYGTDVEYRFEIAVIAIDWTALIVVGALLAARFPDGQSAGGS